MLLTGGCCCGAIRYELSGQPGNLTLCHCPTCRRASGAPNVAWLTVPPTALRWLQGAPRQFRSSAPVLRGFCGECGTALTYQRDDNPDELDVTICSLDDPTLAPLDQTFCQYRLPWVGTQHALREFAATRSEG